MSTKTLPQRLRELRAAARPHFQPHNPDGKARPAAFAIVATAERLDDLVTAADLLEVAPEDLERFRTYWRSLCRSGDIVPPTLQCPDLTAEEVAGIAEQLRGGPAMVTAEPAGDLVSWPAMVVAETAGVLSSWQDTLKDDENQRIDEALQGLRDVIHQRAKLASDLVANLEDNAIRAKLVELGWTPPGEALTHEQVREAARTQLNYRSLDGTVAIHDLCGMLGVKL